MSTWAAPTPIVSALRLPAPAVPAPSTEARPAAAPTRSAAADSDRRPTCKRAGSPTRDRSTDTVPSDVVEFPFFGRVLFRNRSSLISSDSRYKNVGIANSTSDKWTSQNTNILRQLFPFYLHPIVAGSSSLFPFNSISMILRIMNITTELMMRYKYEVWYEVISEQWNAIVMKGRVFI